jgi:hypothetical protein
MKIGFFLLGEIASLTVARVQTFTLRKKLYIFLFLVVIHKYCYDLNFAVNRKCAKVLERSRTGSRTPTSGTGRDKFTRGGENI